MHKKNIVIFTILVCFLINIKIYSQKSGKIIYQDIYFLRFNSHYYKDGAIDKNGCSIQNLRSKKFNIIDQAICSHAIAHGIGIGDESYIRNGMNAIWYGFKKVYNNGIFTSSSVSHSSRFLFSVILSYLDVLYYTDMAVKDKYMKEFQVNASKIKNIAFWIKNSEQFKNDLTGINESANQMISLGILYIAAGDLTASNELKLYGQNFLENGLLMQTDEGIFLERGGFDSSYQAFNLLLVSYLYLYFKDESLNKKAYSMLQKGWEYELKYISTAGEVSVSDNTRTGKNQEMFRGKYKPINYTEVAIALLYWSHISGDKSLRELANKVYDYGMKKNKQ